jgi:hypothetical protein
MDALSSTVGLKVHFDMAALVIASGLYRMLAKAHAATPTRRPVTSAATSSIVPAANVSVSAREVRVHFHRRAHLPIIIASGLLNSSVSVPWRATARCARAPKLGFRPKPARYRRIPGR